MNVLLQQLIAEAVPLFQVECAHLLALKLLISNPTNPGQEILYHAPILST